MLLNITTKARTGTNMYTVLAFHNQSQFVLVCKLSTFSLVCSWPTFSLQFSAVLDN